MKRLSVVLAATLAALLINSGAFAQQAPASPSHKTSPAASVDLNTILMECTFMLEGRTAQGQILGTAFIMGRPIPAQPNRGEYVLITAAHVLDEMTGDTATLQLRRKNGENTYQRVPVSIAIRRGNKPLWTQNPVADVAVMYVPLPRNVVIPLLSTGLLADDKTLSQFEVHPGDELECLGYPLGNASNDAGFPILRSGRIASYPLLPTATTKTFLLDVRVFKGNSGGPVYLWDSNRTYQGGVHLGQVGFIVGLVSQERLFSQVNVGPYSQNISQIPLDLAVVVYSSLIRQTIDMLPASPGK